MGPGTGLHSSYAYPTMHKNLPFNGLLYTQPQVISLYGHKHEDDDVVTECIGGHFNETSTSLSMVLHLYRIDINTAHVHQLAKP